MNRDDLHQLSRQRLREARTLLQANFPDGAYYLAGYAVECALKACIARQTRRHEFPDKELATKVWSHNLDTLVTHAALRVALETEAKKSQAFGVNWAIVKDWAPGSRYQAKNSKEARDLYSAITRRRSGVMSWIRRHW